MVVAASAAGATVTALVITGAAGFTASAATPEPTHRPTVRATADTGQRPTAEAVAFTRPLTVAPATVSFARDGFGAQTPAPSAPPAAPPAQPKHAATPTATPGPQPSTTPSPAPRHAAPAPVTTGGSPQATARQLLAASGLGDDQFQCLVKLWNKESGWRVTASNASGAYGIPQALPGSKMASAGSDWRTDATTQISWGLGYIASQYGSPCGAWSASQAHGWY